VSVRLPSTVGATGSSGTVDHWLVWVRHSWLVLVALVRRMKVGQMKWFKLLGGLVAIAALGYMLVWWLAVGRYTAVG
jgi:hypothetical protein